jgi:hypothetical protein
MVNAHGLALWSTIEWHMDCCTKRRRVAALRSVGARAGLRTTQNALRDLLLCRSDTISILSRSCLRNVRRVGGSVGGVVLWSDSGSSWSKAGAAL